jgi:hypothetical protein
MNILAMGIPARSSIGLYPAGPAGRETDTSSRSTVGSLISVLKDWVFFIVADSRDKLEQRRLDHNQVRLARALGDRASEEFADRWQAAGVETASLEGLRAVRSLSYCRFQTAGISGTHQSCGLFPTADRA